MKEPEVKVKSLHKALKILNLFSTERPELGVTQVSQILGIYKSNAHNILSTFEHNRILERNPENGKFRLGVKILEMSNVVSSNLGMRNIIYPFMQELSDKAGEKVYLAIHDGDGYCVYLDVAYPHNSLPIRSMLGIKAPLYCTGVGKAILAFLPNEVINKVISRGLKEFTERTITDEEELIKELSSIRKKGYAIDNMEHEFGVKCVGVPLFDSHENVFASLSLSGPSLRFSCDRISFFAKLLMDSAAQIKERF